MKIDEREDLRKKLDEKSKKYQHLPVFDKEEEKRKNQKLEKKMTKIFSDVDKQLGTVTDLTSSHMENKGIKLVPTPFDESERRASDSPSAQSDVHTIKFKSGVLDNKRSVEKNQGTLGSPKEVNLMKPRHIMCHPLTKESHHTINQMKFTRVSARHSET